MNTSHALIVDDDIETQKIFSIVLSSMGYQIGQAYSVEEALDYLTHTYPMIMLLDMMLPGQSGLELLEIIRGDDALQNIYVIFISAHTYNQHDMPSGVAPDAVLRKPIRITDLRDAVAKALA